MDLNFQHIAEVIQVMGSNLVDKVKELIHEGNVQRIIIKNEQGHTLVEIPVTLAAIGIVAAPVLAAVSAIAGIVKSARSLWNAANHLRRHHQQHNAPLKPHVTAVAEVNVAALKNSLRLGHPSPKVRIIEADPVTVICENHASRENSPPVFFDVP